MFHFSGYLITVAGMLQCLLISYSLELCQFSFAFLSLCGFPLQRPLLNPDFFFGFGYDILTFFPVKCFSYSNENSGLCMLIFLSLSILSTLFPVFLKSPTVFPFSNKRDERRFLYQDLCMQNKTFAFGSYLLTFALSSV